MADIIIWQDNPGPISGSTPFGWYDNDPLFQIEGPKLARFCAIRLGYMIVEVELVSGSIYAAFEEAITTYGNELYRQKIIDNYLSLEGNLVPTSSEFSLNNSVITPNLGRVIQIAKTYGTEAGSGGNVKYHTGSFDLISGVQNYDLNAWSVVSGGLNGDNDYIEIKRIFYEAPPAIVRYFDPYAGTGTGFQSLLSTFGFGQFSPGINFMLMPIYFDLEKIQAIEFNDQIRKSAFSFDLVGNQLRIFPVPFNWNEQSGSAGKLFFHYIKGSERDANISNQLSGGGYGTFISGSSTNRPITNPGNVPFNNPTYSEINSIGRDWIYKYTLAICKEILGLIRTKYDVIPIPNSEVRLNGNSLLELARKEKDDLLEVLRKMLSETSRKTQIEMKKDESDMTKDILTNVPMAFYVF